MDIKVGISYKFEFDSPFTALGYSINDPTNGYYKVLEASLYEHLVEEGTDFVAMLYEKVGLEASDYAADKAGYAGKEFYRLFDLNDDETIIYMPETAITQVPIVDVAEYGKVILATNLDIVADTEILEGTITLFQDIMRYLHGIEATTEVLTYDQQWMTKEEYDELQETRDAVKGTSGTRPTILDGTEYPFNMFAEIKRLMAVNAEIQTANDQLKAIIIDAGIGS